MYPQSGRFSTAEEDVLEVHFKLNWWWEIGRVAQDSWWVPARPPLCSGALSGLPVGGWCWNVLWGACTAAGVLS